MDKLLLSLLEKRRQLRDEFFEGPHPQSLEQVMYRLGQDAALTEQIGDLTQLLKGLEDNE